MACVPCGVCLGVVTALCVCGAVIACVCFTSWPANLSSSLPLAASHARALLSFEAENSRRCSPSSAQPFTGLVWPSNLTTVLADPAFHARMMESSPELYSVSLSGPISTCVTGFSCPLNRWLCCTSAERLYDRPSSSSSGSIAAPRAPRGGRRVETESGPK